MLIGILIAFIGALAAGFVLWLMPDKWKTRIPFKIRKKWRSIKERFHHKETPEEREAREGKEYIEDVFDEDSGMWNEH